VATSGSEWTWWKAKGFLGNLEEGVTLSRSRIGEVLLM
jgi:hypothetical protein